jgi:hypothetical protein
MLVPGGPPPQILVRVYRAYQQSDAVAVFQTDAASLADHGYRPVSQSWAQGQWGCGAWLVALLLCFVLIGGLVFLYMLIVKPDGTLTVTYELASRSTSAPAATRSQLSVLDRLARLDILHDSGVVTDQQYATKRAQLLDEL